MIDNLKSSGWSTFNNGESIRLSRQFRFEDPAQARDFVSAMGTCMSVPHLFVFLERVPGSSKVTASIEAGSDGFLHRAASEVALALEAYFTAPQSSAA